MTTKKCQVGTGLADTAKHCGCDASHFAIITHKETAPSAIFSCEPHRAVWAGFLNPTWKPMSEWREPTPTSKGGKLPECFAKGQDVKGGK